MEILAAWLAVAVAVLGATLWWSASLFTRFRSRACQRVLAGLVIATALTWQVGTIIGLGNALSATGGASRYPSQKARIVAEGIATAMNCTAAGLLLWLPKVIIWSAVSRHRARARP